MQSSRENQQTEQGLSKKKEIKRPLRTNSQTHCLLPKQVAIFILTDVRRRWPFRLPSHRTRSLIPSTARFPVTAPAATAALLVTTRHPPAPPAASQPSADSATPRDTDLPLSEPGLCPAPSAAASVHRALPAPPFRPWRRDAYRSAPPDRAIPAQCRPYRHCRGPAAMIPPVSRKPAAALVSCCRRRAGWPPGRVGGSARWR